MDPETRMQLLIWYKSPTKFYEDLYGHPPFPYQARVLKFIPKLRRLMILSASGTGKSELLAGIGLWLCIPYSYYIKRSYDVIILAGSQDQARSLYNYTSEILPEHPVLSKLVDGEVQVTQCRFKTGSMIRALPTSLKSVQGKHTPCVIIDEAVLAGDFFIKDAYRIVGGFPDSRIILSGTPMEYSSLFVEMWDDLKNYPDYFSKDKPDPLDWARFSWSVMECPRITKEEVEEAKRRLSDEQFSIFWLGKPYPVTNTVVPVELIRRQSIGYSKFQYDPAHKVGKIIFGIDWGMTDRSVLVIVQILDDQYRVLEIDEWRGQRYENVHDWIKAYAIKYKPDHIFVDLNPKGESSRCVDRLMPLGFDVKAINMGQERGSLQVRMKYLFEHSKIIIPQDDEFQPLLNEIKRYTWDQIKNDDRVTALMLSLKNINEEEYQDQFYYKISSFKRKRLW